MGELEEIIKSRREDMEHTKNSIILPAVQLCYIITASGCLTEALERYPNIVGPVLPLAIIGIATVPFGIRSAYEYASNFLEKRNKRV
ncbi:MAG: hypothetical protein AABX11_07375 [Nanoarchaeota archaeon]